MGALRDLSNRGAKSFAILLAFSLTDRLTCEVHQLGTEGVDIAPRTEDASPSDHVAMSPIARIPWSCLPVPLQVRLICNCFILRIASSFSSLRSRPFRSTIHGLARGIGYHAKTPLGSLGVSSRAGTCVTFRWTNSNARRWRIDGHRRLH
jgi:hypothetical protein